MNHLFLGTNYFSISKNLNFQAISTKLPRNITEQKPLPDDIPYKRILSNNNGKK